MVLPVSQYHQEWVSTHRLPIGWREWALNTGLRALFFPSWVAH